MDPRAQLDMLQAAQDATEVEAWMPPTPLWHAPLLATAIAGIALINSDAGNWAIAGAVVGGVALVVGLVDQYRRRRASPRGMRKPFRVLVFYGFIVLVTLGILQLWSTVELNEPSARTATTLIGAWLATTAVFAIGITITERTRNRWTSSPQ